MYFEKNPEDNPFYSLCIDITHRCNMECANCYVPNRDYPDLDKDRVFDALSRLPKRTEIRLIGGEPTVRTDLVEIVNKIRELGHRPTMMTNGLKLASPGYARDLADAGMRSIYISLNGADDDDVYEIMDGVRCADRKIKAWVACADAKMNINLGAILQKDVNNHVPKRLLELSKEIGGNNILRFRNIGQIGRFAVNNQKNWSKDELVKHVCDQLNVDYDRVVNMNTINGYKEKNIVFFPLDPNTKTKGTWVKITDWNPYNSLIPDPDSMRRGRLTQNFKVAPFFEHVKLYENVY